MTNLTSKILPRIANNQIDKLPLLDGMTLPFYEGLSLVNVPGTITQLMGVKDFGKPPLNEVITKQLGGPYQKVVLVLIDALGIDLLNRMMSTHQDLVWKKYFDRAVFAPITSVCPSTTASALTTLWTGEGPAVHGIIGYEMWAKEFGMIINNILHSAASGKGDVGGLSRSGFDPYAFIGKPLLGVHLRDQGISPSTFIHASISHSGLSEMQMKDVNVHAYVDEADLCVSLADYINARQGKREYIYVYYSDVDSLMHRYSAENERVSLQFGAFSHLFEEAFFKRLSPAVAEDTLLILTADHGSKSTPKDPRYDLSNHAKLMDCLVMQPTCENRLAFLYVKPERMQTVREYFSNTWPDDFILLDPEEVLESGLLGNGPFNENTRERLGDLIVAAKGDAYLWWAPKPNPMAGRHGGLSREEMLVPFYALPLRMLG